MIRCTMASPPRCLQIRHCRAAVEIPEQFMRILHIETGPVVFYIIYKLIILFLCAQLNSGRILFRGIFNGIGNKVDVYLRQKRDGSP